MVRELPFYQVDAFTDRVFRGNPAGVVPLDEWLPDEVMQSIGTGNNLSETAFFVKEGGEWDLRWFTPTVEMDLCGHATLASAFVITTYLEPGRTSFRFRSRSGPLAVTRRPDGLYALDFPAWPGAPCATPPALVEALGARPDEVLASRDYLAVFRRQSDVSGLAPDLDRVAKLDRQVIVTAPGEDCDFVSRYFGPGVGIPEDPATGSAHCTLVPYWSQRLGKRRLFARQLSKRTGEFHCEDLGERVLIAGNAVCYLVGTLRV
jgi:predicted PhzF superfamily epimerase YddE/YHI9